MPPTERSFPAQFDPTAWEQDVARASADARKAATAARERYEAAGVPLAELRPCEAQGRDGTELPACFKTYLPSPAGRFGIVFRVKSFDDGARLVYLAFGEALEILRGAERRRSILSRRPRQQTIDPLGSDRLVQCARSSQSRSDRPSAARSRTCARGYLDHIVAV